MDIGQHALTLAKELSDFEEALLYYGERSFISVKNSESDKFKKIADKVDVYRADFCFSSGTFITMDDKNISITVSSSLWNSKQCFRGIISDLFFKTVATIDNVAIAANILKALFEKTF